MRTNFDLAPYRRSTVGFDRLFDWLQSPSATEGLSSPPPFNLERLDQDNHRITLAVPGYGVDDIEITAEQNQLRILGRRNAKEEQDHYVHRGISAGQFERRFQLGDFVHVTNARLKDGMLVIDLRREIPEAMKSRKIPIGSASARPAPEDQMGPGQKGASEKGAGQKAESKKPESVKRQKDDPKFFQHF